MKNNKFNTKEPQDKNEDLTSIEKTENYLRQHYDFRYNEVTGRIEFTEKEQHCFAPLTDYELNSLVVELTKAGFYCTTTNLRSLLLSAFSPRYNPFDEYFKHLPQWDGADYIFQLSSTVKTTNDRLWHECFRKWLVAAVGCVLHENVTNHTVIVLNGPQGIGKTTWLENLLPEDLKNYIYSGIINPENKDALIHLSQSMFLNMDELETLHKKALSSLKEIITKKNINIRRPYGFHAENLPRRASFMGSVNNPEFLSDTTGNRRFLCFETQDIDNNHKVLLSDVYAQALHLYKNGFQYWFDLDEIAIINANNEKFRTASAEEDLIIRYFTNGSKNQGDVFQTTSQIAEWLVKNGSNILVNDATLKRLGQALALHNFTREKNGGRYGYYLKYRQDKKSHFEMAA